MDFINQAMLLAAVLLLCFVPFVIVSNALAGRSAVTGLARRLGLNHEAATDLGHLFASSTATSNAITGAAYVLFVLGGIAAASAIADLYLATFGLTSRGMRDLPRRIAWLCVLVAGALFTNWAAPGMRAAGGPVLMVAAGFVGFTLFWWFTMWLLLAGRIPWRELLPGAIATGLFWLGMEVVFGLVSSSSVISDYDKYGPIGVVFWIMSWLVAMGVVIVLGAVVGMVWNERRSRAPDQRTDDGPAEASATVLDDE